MGPLRAPLPSTIIATDMSRKASTHISQSSNNPCCRGDYGHFESGFSLIELISVVVIIGVLSSIALPNFLNQTSKARGTECTAKATAILKQVAAEAVTSQSDANNLGAFLSNEETSGSNVCAFTFSNISNNIAVIDALGVGDLENKFDGNACVNINTGKISIKTSTANADAPECS